MNPFARFLAAGGVAAAVNWGTKCALDGLVGTLPAIVLAYAVGVAVAYALNRTLVFGSSGAIGGELSRFVAVNLASLTLVIVTTLSLSRWIFPAISYTWFPEESAHAVGVVSPTVLSYLGHRYFTFTDAEAKA